MKTPNNETDPNMNTTNQNLYIDPRQPVYTPVQNPNLVPVQPVILAPAYQQPPVQPIIIQAPPANTTPQVVVIKEGEKRYQPSGRCCYCRGPKQSPCGCLDYNEEYCCFIVCMSYVIMSLQYILTCLCIMSLCRSFCR